MPPRVSGADNRPEITPRRGLRFVHARMLDAATGRPLELVVTAVRRGVVYYRGADGCGSWRCDVERFAEKVQPHNGP